MEPSVWATKTTDEITAGIQEIAGRIGTHEPPDTILMPTLTWSMVHRGRRALRKRENRRKRRLRIRRGWR